MSRSEDIVNLGIYAKVVNIFYLKFRSLQRQIVLDALQMLRVVSNLVTFATNH